MPPVELILDSRFVSMSELELCLLTEGCDFLQHYGPYNNYLKSLQLDHRACKQNRTKKPKNQSKKPRFYG
jgi:hypothetical protein